MPSHTRPPTPSTDSGPNTRQQLNNLLQTLDNLNRQQEAADAARALHNEPYLLTSRAHNPPLDMLPRAIIKLHQHINLKALALLRTGIGRNLISRQLIQQLHIVPYATTLTEEDPESGLPLPVYGAVVLRVVVVDDGGEERESEVRFLVTDMYEDVVFGVEWMYAADVIVGASARAFLWNRGGFGEDEEDVGEEGDGDGDVEYDGGEV